ncbi:glycosyltransferase [Ancylobacter sp. G4_0304]|uniref:glycosyltransferase n=1 Tax=Ancylobacter sp. G4_0304 TaxID=3114289 RepID=UPI0039C61FC6
MRLLVDTLAYALGRPGLTRVWSALLPALAMRTDVDLVLLDRGGCPDVAGARRIAFPSYHLGNTAEDSRFIDAAARMVGAEAFVSTWHSSPLTIPSVALVADMIPEREQFDVSLRIWKEKETALSFASAYLCLSETARADLTRVYPSIDASRIASCAPPLDLGVFRPRGDAEIAAFRASHGVPERYLVLRGGNEARAADNGAAMLVGALKRLKGEAVHVLCVGRPSWFAFYLSARLPSHVTLQCLDIGGEELARAYSGALGLIYPSPTEAMELTAIEAMACGCPVIAAQVAPSGFDTEDPVLAFADGDHAALLSALVPLDDADGRRQLVANGQRKAAAMGGGDLAGTLHGLLEQVVADSRSERMQMFFRRWSELRTLQADVDIGL